MAPTRSQVSTIILPDSVPGLRILIAEDETDCAENLALWLGMCGHEVVIAGDGLTALEMVLRDEPDVVLLDVGLPGMNGHDVAKQISGHRSWKKKPLLIAVTGFGQEEDHRHSKEVGIDLHMVKPVDPEQLRTILRRFQRIIDRRTGEQ